MSFNKDRKEQVFINNSLQLIIWQLAIAPRLFARELFAYVHALGPEGAVEQQPTVTLVKPL